MIHLPKFLCFSDILQTCNYLPILTPSQQPCNFIQFVCLAVSQNYRIKTKDNCGLSFILPQIVFGPWVRYIGYWTADRESSFRQIEDRYKRHATYLPTKAVGTENKERWS